MIEDYPASQVLGDILAQVPQLISAGYVVSVHMMSGATIDVFAWNDEQDWRQWATSIGFTHAPTYCVNCRLDDASGLMRIHKQLGEMLCARQTR